MKEKKSESKKVAVKKVIAKARTVKPIIKKEIVPSALVSLHTLKAPLGSHKKRKIKGRGPSSGHGKTSTRGSKGQTSRAGRHFYLGFEGGQSPLIRKFPKRGFVSNFKKTYQLVNLDDLNRIKVTGVVTPEILKSNGLIRNALTAIKILGKGSIKKPLTIQAHAFSKRAASEIVSAGGKAEILNV